MAALSKASADESKLAEANVKDYGATGDGTTDDTAAIHAAKDATRAGGKVIIPPGTYMVSGLAADVADQTWELSNEATIKMMVGATASLSITANGVSVVGGIFDASNGSVHDWSQHGIVISADGITVRNATVLSSPASGIYALNRNRVSISGCTIINSWLKGIFVQNALPSPSEIHDISITNNLIESSSGGENAGGIGAFGNSPSQRVNRISISGNTVRLPYAQSKETESIAINHGTDYTVENNMVLGGYIGISCPGSIRGTISNNMVRGFTRIGIEIAENIENLTVTGNTTDPDGVSYGAGIQASNGTLKNVVISHNRINSFPVGPSTGISFSSGAALNGVTIHSNTIISAVASGKFNGLTFNDSANSVAIVGNFIDATSTTDSYGIQFLNSTRSVTILGNHFSNIAKLVCNVAAMAAGKPIEHQIDFTANVIRNCGPAIGGAVGTGVSIGFNIFAD